MEMIKDRYGREITIGTPVIFTEYRRDTILYEGVVTAIKPKTIVCERCLDDGTLCFNSRIIKIENVKTDLIVNTNKK